jgi:hypothetical protein
LDEEGRRWCGTHGADAHIKSPVPCAGLATDGKHCRKTADVITIVDGVDHTLCSFHDELYRDLGTIRAPGVTPRQGTTLDSRWPRPTRT